MTVEQLTLQHESRIADYAATVEYYGVKGDTLTLGSRTGGTAPRRRPVRNVDSDERFDTTAEAERHYGLPAGALAKAISRNQRRGGYRWEYLTPKGGAA